MQQPTIGNLLKGRNAWLKGTPGDVVRAEARADVSRAIADDYVVFEEVRDLVIASSDAFLRHSTPVKAPERLQSQPLVSELLEHGIVSSHPEHGLICEMEGRRYLSGGWLEELAWLAANEAGADEAIFGQSLGWQVAEYNGENEVDLIARKGDALAFVSCKALRSELDIHDRKHRNRLMDAVHEADNLTDHFGRGGERVAVLVTTDLFDEVRNVARYAALMGKAAVLDVRIIALEELRWSDLVKAVGSLWENPHAEARSELRMSS